VPPALHQQAFQYLLQSEEFKLDPDGVLAELQLMQDNQSEFSSNHETQSENRASVPESGAGSSLPGHFPNGEELYGIRDPFRRNQRSRSSGARIPDAVLVTTPPGRVSANRGPLYNIDPSFQSFLLPDPERPPVQTTIPNYFQLLDMTRTKQGPSLVPVNTRAAYNSVPPPASVPLAQSFDPSDLIKKKLDKINLLTNDRVNRTPIHVPTPVAKKLFPDDDDVSVLTTTTERVRQDKVMTRQERAKSDYELCYKQIQRAVISSTPEQMVERMKALHLSLNICQDLDGIKSHYTSNEFGNKLYEALLVMFRLCRALGDDLFLNIIKTNFNLVSLNTKYSERLETQRTYMATKKRNLKSTKVPIEPSDKDYQLNLAIALGDNKELIMNLHDELLDDLDSACNKGTEVYLANHAQIESSRSLGLAKNIEDTTRAHQKEYQQLSFIYKEAKLKYDELQEQVDSSAAMILENEQISHFLGHLINILDTINNKVIFKLNDNSTVYEKLNSTITIGVTEIKTPVSERSLPGMFGNLIKSYKSGDMGTFFTELLVHLSMSESNLETLISKVDDIHRKWDTLRLFEKYFNVNVLDGMAIIRGLNDKQKQTSLIKFCQTKWFNLMSQTEINNAEDMIAFQETNGTLMSVIRLFAEQQTLTAKLTETTDDTSNKSKPKMNATLTDQLKAKLHGLSHNTIKKLSDMANAASSNTSNSNPSVAHANAAVKSTGPTTHKVVTDIEMIAHISGGPVIHDGLTYYPMDRRDVHYPLYATVMTANLKKDMKLSDNVWTMANGSPFTYESYKDPAHLPIPANVSAHFTKGNQCKRCKSYGHYIQRCLQASA
jgi:hypothetical protein